MQIHICIMIVPINSEIKFSGGIMHQINMLPIYYKLTYSDLLEAFNNLIYDSNIKKGRMGFKSKR